MKFIIYECPECHEVLLRREGTVSTKPLCYHKNHWRPIDPASMAYCGTITTEP